MPYIQSISEENAGGVVAETYENVKEIFGYVPNFVSAFSLRPEVLAGWNVLLESIKKNMDQRRYELVTMAAAKELRSSYCLLAHGSVLLDGHFNDGELKSIMDTQEQSPLDEGEKAVMKFAAKVVRDAASITQEDVETLRGYALNDEEIFDIASAAAARCFFSKTLDALGVQPDSQFNSVETGLRNVLTVGRSIEG